MRVRITPGSRLRGSLAVPGDKSIAHRWLILAATALDSSRLLGVPASLDVRSTASCLALLSPKGRPGLEAWSGNGAAIPHGHGSTWNARAAEAPDTPLEVEGEGWSGLAEPTEDLDCGNSGTTMRLLAGVARGRALQERAHRGREPVGAPDGARRRPAPGDGGHDRHDRGARADRGRRRRPARGSRTRPRCPPPRSRARCWWPASRPRARPRSASLRPPAITPSVALAALGAPVERDGTSVTIEPFQHDGFEGRVPGDPSSAAFLVAAAALTGSELTITGVGLNPSRTRFLDVMARMGVRTEARVGSDRARGARRRPVGRAVRRRARDPRDRGRTAAGDRRGPDPRDDGHARAGRHVVPGRAGAPREGVRPARRPRARDRRPRRSRRGRG